MVLVLRTSVSLTRWYWRSSHGAWWPRILCFFYLPTCSLFYLGSETSNLIYSFFVWPSLKPLYTSLLLESRWLVCHHSKVHFWIDNWFVTPLIIRLGNILCHRVSELGFWWMGSPHLIPILISSLASEIEMVLVTPDPDSRVWALFLDVRSHMQMA